MDIQDTISKMEAIRRGKSGLDEIADRIIQKSKSAISKIEENIELTTSLRKSNSLISKINAQIDGLTSNLQQYQYYLSQLNSLLIRSEFFEAQLNMLEAHSRLDSLRSSNGMPSLNDWKDKDLNWRTTEATLENLYLEYEYLTKQMDEVSDPRSFDSFISSQHEKQEQLQQDTSSILDQEPQPTLQDKSDNFESMNLKPIRCISRTKERQRRRSMDWKKKKPIAVFSKPQSSHMNLQNLPTPETSFDTSFNDTTINNDVAESNVILSTTPLLQKMPIPKRCPHPVNKHIRCASLPESIVSNMLDTVRFKLHDVDESTSDELKKDRKFSLRHFISHDTGLKTKCLIDEEDEDVKDSEYLNSPVSLKLESFLKEHVRRDIVTEKLQDEDGYVKESQEIEEADEEEVTVFEHKLNRSNSCDSIFSTMKPEPFIQRDNTQQTMNWMKTFAQPHGSYAKESNITTISINNLSSSSISSPSRQALSNLVTQNTRQSQTKTSNRFPYLFAAKKPSPLTAAATTTTTTTATSISDQTVTPTPISKAQLPVDDSSSYHSFGSSYSNSQQHKQWALLLNKFKPKSLIPSSNLVTSEIGKPINQALPIPISPLTSNSIQKYRAPPIITAAGDPIKGSFSTLTIGPNGSRHVQHGHSSTLGRSMVLSSKISHAALKDAIDSDFIFE